MTVVSLVVVTDGRGELVEQTIRSADRMLVCDWSHRVIVDDSGDPAYGVHLTGLFPGWRVVSHDERRGLSGAVRTAWAVIPEREWLFHLEDDWTFPQRVDVLDMVEVCRREGLAQVALTRNAVSPAEFVAGGLIEANPGWYTRRGGWVSSSWGFTLNPHVVAPWCRDVGWPDGGGEREFTDRLEARGRVQFGLYGSLVDPPRCVHLGSARTPSWRL